MSLIGHSRYEGLRCPHCAGKLPGYVSRDAELTRIREETMVDTEVVRLQNQLAEVVGVLTLWLNFAPLEVRAIVPGSNGKTLEELTRVAFGGSNDRG